MADQTAPTVPAHDQTFTNRYVVGYFAHEPRADDPHKIDFDAWKQRQRDSGNWRCSWAAKIDDDSECDLTKPLEAHHSHLELALMNNVNFTHLEHLYPGISDPDKVGAWIDGDANLTLYCCKHHRAVSAGIHHLDGAMWEASYVLTDGTLRPVTTKAAANVTEQA